MTDAFDVPGYIGWIGNVEKSNLAKCYVSTLSNKSLEEMYTQLACHFPVELIKINAQKDMNSVFFGENNNFCHFYSHNEFYLSAIPTGLTLEDLLNFVPSHEIDDFISSEAEKTKRLALQDTMMHKFCASYTGYYCKSICVTKPELPVMYETSHKNILMEKLISFGPSKYFVFEDITVQGLRKNPPTGNIDVVSCEDYHEGNANIVAFSSFGAMSEEKRCNVFSATAKTEGSYDDPGSDRQAVVELLALSKVVSQQGAKFIILIKATTFRYRPYLYFPMDDVLIRTATDLLFEANMKEDPHDTIGKVMMGTFVFYLLLRHAVNPYFIEKIKQEVNDDDQKCGWKSVFESSGALYNSCLKIQKYPKKRSSESVEMMPVRAKERRKVNKFPPLDFHVVS